MLQFFFFVKENVAYSEITMKHTIYVAGWLSSVVDCEVSGIEKLRLSCRLVCKYFRQLFATWSVHKERNVCCWLLDAVADAASH